MKHPRSMTEAERVIRRISDLRDLCRRLSQAGYEAGLHSHNPNSLPTNKVAEKTAAYRVRSK